MSPGRALPSSCPCGCIRKRAGKGVGRVLVETVLQWARTEGHTVVRLWVTETNDPARRLYERCGFTLTGERKPLPSYPEYAEIAMLRPA